ncbi:MAG: transposase [Thermodesulfobacteriota bacterium]
MARLARVVAPRVPHHVTQRGNRRQQTFSCDDDYEAYIELMAEWCCRCSVAVWAYCLMPNHVHLIVVPSSEAGLRSAVGEAHRRYSRRINFREGCRGWSNRRGYIPGAVPPLI